jgi:hypothetical protein
MPSRYFLTLPGGRRLSVGCIGFPADEFKNEFMTCQGEAAQRNP